MAIKINEYLLMALIISLLMISPMNANAAPTITNPSPGLTLSGTTETISWIDNGTAVSAWWGVGGVM